MAANGWKRYKEEGARVSSPTSLPSSWVQSRSRLEWNMEPGGIWHILGLLIKVIIPLPCPCSELWSHGTLWRICVEGMTVTKPGPHLCGFLHPRIHGVIEFHLFVDVQNENSERSQDAGIGRAARVPAVLLCRPPGIHAGFICSVIPGFRNTWDESRFLPFLPYSCSRFLSPEESIGTIFT